MACLLDYILLPVRYHLDIGRPAWLPIVDKRIVSWAACRLCTLRFVLAFEFEIEHMDISSFPCTQLVFAFSLGWTQETDVRVTSSSLLKSSGKPEEVFPTNIFSVLNECPTPFIYWALIVLLPYSRVSRFLAGQKVTGRFMCYCFFLAGCQSRKRLCLIDARPTREQAHILARPCKLPGFSMFDMNVLSTKNRRVTWEVSVDVVWLLSSCLLIQLMKRKRAWRNKEKTSLGNEVDWLLQASTVTWKRVIGAF